MSLPKLRELSKFGVVADVDPYDLPPQAFSFAANVRFRAGKVESAPVWRNVFNVGTADPRFIGSSNPTSGQSNVFIGYTNGRVYRYTEGAETNYSPTGYVDSTAEAVWTETNLADVYYVNREDRVPWRLLTSDTEFDELANWDASWRTRLLRTCGSALVALNVTKGATNYPTMIKTSSIPTSGIVPTSWDHTDPATNATEDILAEMEGPIIDAASLGNDLYIYGQNETWVMVADGSAFVFSKKRVFKHRGAINSNCAVEINGKHYVFGPDDIWVHDGVSEQSLCDGIVREFIYDDLDITKNDRCFVKYYPQLREIRFHYVAADDYATFVDQDGCNRVAVYSVKDGVWVFDDAPLVHSATVGHLSSAATYATVVGTYATIGGTYSSFDESISRTLLYVGDTYAAAGLTASLYAFDKYGHGSTSAHPVDEVATRPRYLERDGIDLDELDLDLRGYKVVSRVYPQARIDDGAEPIQFTFGSSDYFNQDTTFGDAQEYTGSDADGYKIDPNMAGRYLAMQVLHDDYRNMSISGFDFDLEVTGER
jgi:hypothetical protein